VNPLLHNPVFNALLTGDRHLSFGNELVRYFDEQVSPFAGFKEGYKNGFGDLYDIFPSGREILYANPIPISIPAGWQLRHAIKGLQFVYEKVNELNTVFSEIIPLAEMHVMQMMALAKLTRPGPFGLKTIDFGSYYGIFEKDKLVAMTGQRLHVKNFTEVSAVCTHPDHTGKGYAFKLMQHQLQIILKLNQHPFLHVREDNQRAIALYHRLGFTISRPMNFYFMKRE
jgi:ribosomal protein S18 acetylase RimI-like enzyme